MKKHLFTIIALLVVTITQGQNQITGPITVTGVTGDFSGSNGTSISTGGSITVGVTGTWYFNNATITTPRSAATQAEAIRINNPISGYNRSTGYCNGYASISSPIAGFVLPIGQSVYMPVTFTSANAATVQAAWYDAGTPASVLIGTDAYNFRAGFYDVNSSAAASTITVSAPAGTPAGTHLLGTANNGVTFADLGLANATVTLPSGGYKIYFGDQGITVNAKVYLQGAAISGAGGLMRTDINDGTALSMATSQPFNTSAFGNYNGGESVSAAFFTAHPTIVDWVMIEVRSATDFTNVLARRAAFVTSNGVLIDIDAATGVNFRSITSGNYFVSVSHRNHLVVLTPGTQVLSATSLQYDFTTGIAKAMDNGSGNAMVKVGNLWAMWAGDINHDNSIDGVDRSKVNTDFLAGYFDEYRIGDIYLDGNTDGLDNSLAGLNFGFGIISPLF